MASPHHDSPAHTDESEENIPSAHSPEDYVEDGEPSAHYDPETEEKIKPKQKSPTSGAAETFDYIFTIFVRAVFFTPLSYNRKKAKEYADFDKWADKLDENPLNRDFYTEYQNAPREERQKVVDDLKRSEKIKRDHLLAMATSYLGLIAFLSITPTSIYIMDISDRPECPIRVVRMICLCCLVILVVASGYSLWGVFRATKPTTVRENLYVADIALGIGGYLLAAGLGATLSLPIYLLANEATCAPNFKG